MIQLNFSPRVSNFIDAADVSGNIKNNSLNLQYLNQIDNACVKAGITTGAVYPFIGGVADSHKFNFLDPRDLDAAFRLTWFGSITHTNMGIQSDGLTGYGNTHLILNNIPELLYNNIHLSNYINIGNSLATFDIGGAASPSTRITGLISNWSDNKMQAAINSSSYAISSNTVSSNGSNIASANSSNIFLCKNGALINSNIVTSTIDKTNYSLYLCALNTAGELSRVSSRRQAFISIGNGLSDEKAKVFSHDIYIAQRSLGRA